MDGLDIVFAEFTESGGRWTFEIRAAETLPYEASWRERLLSAASASAYDYLLLHSAYGQYLGNQVNQFIDQHQLHHQVQLVASHGHTVFHAPQQGMTAQLGDGAALAAITGINVVSDLRAVDVALGGQGAPIVPVGEKLLFADYPLLLNIGGIANLSWKYNDSYTAFDICPANRVLNMLSMQLGQPFDEGGSIARSGQILPDILERLAVLDYYRQAPPKSLPNQFGTDVVFPMMPASDIPSSLSTYTRHIAQQVANSVAQLPGFIDNEPRNMLVTGGGAHNSFLVEQLQELLQPLNVSVVVPDADIINYKEALIMALLGILRWREQDTVMALVTGARRSSIGGAVWIGQDA